MRKGLSRTGRSAMDLSMYNLGSDSECGVEGEGEGEGEGGRSAPAVPSSSERLEVQRGSAQRGGHSPSGFHKTLSHQDSAMDLMLSGLGLDELAQDDVLDAGSGSGLFRKTMHHKGTRANLMEMSAGTRNLTLTPRLTGLGGEIGTGELNASSSGSGLFTKTMKHKATAANLGRMVIAATRLKAGGKSKGHHEGSDSGGGGLLVSGSSLTSSGKLIT